MQHAININSGSRRIRISFHRETNRAREWAGTMQKTSTLRIVCNMLLNTALVVVSETGCFHISLFAIRKFLNRHYQEDRWNIIAARAEFIILSNSPLSDLLGSSG